jgi:hypothetical protein
MMPSVFQELEEFGKSRGVALLQLSRGNVRSLNRHAKKFACCQCRQWCETADTGLGTMSDWMASHIALHAREIWPG